MQELNISQIEQLLYERIKDDQFNTLATLPQPNSFKDISKATNRIIEAIKNDETINIIGDYDADGVISTAIMVEFFNKAIGIEVNYIIPNRFEHGYGISEQILELVYDGIIITVDNGISAIEAANIAKNRGLDLIITDHHTVGETLPDAYAIINPKQDDCHFPFKDICGANVAWYLCANIKKQLNLKFNLMDFFDILSIAIVADVMPMRSLNKTIVKKGLQILQTSQRPAIVAFRERLSLTNINEDDIGFKIAPLINCAGRMEDANIALEFLLSYDTLEASYNLDYLVELNNQRKEQQNSIFEEAKLQVTNDDIIVVSSSKWNEGIIGIVASKLCDKYKKPAFVFTIKDNIAKASARSVANINLYNLIETVQEFTLGFGGHKGAAGLSVETNKLNQFKTAINQAIINIPSQDKQLQNDALCMLNINNVNDKLYNMINNFRPFGLENNLPVFYFHNLIVKDIKYMGTNNQYQKLSVGNNNTSIDLLIFTDTITVQINDTISFLATINQNNFRGDISYNLMFKELL